MEKSKFNHKSKLAFTPDKVESPEQKIYNLIILDESGSMDRIKDEAISGLNETFQTIINAQKEHKEQEHFITFVTFNSTRIRTIMNRKAVECNKKLEWKDYMPDNCTPLYDAMGGSLNGLRNHISEEDVVLVTVITDGYENASKKYDRHDIKNLVDYLKEKGWVFTYIGTNQDVDAVADGMGIRSRMEYEFSEMGTSEMFALERKSRSRFYKILSRRGKRFFADAESYDYFEPDDNYAQEPEKEPDITWGVDDKNPEPSPNVYKQENSEMTTDDNYVQPVSIDSSSDTDEPKKRLGFWQKLKNLI